MTREGELHVQIGQVKIGYAGQSLNAILGSCIGLGFLDAPRGVFGLAHALLPKSNGQAANGSGRHVDHAIESLLEGMEVSKIDRKKIHVFIAGGANMTLPIDAAPERLVGLANADSARAALKAAGMRIAQDETGGEFGRRVRIDCTTGAFTIEPIPRLGAA